MKDRIQKLITSEQLTASKFADKIGVRRSNISHILSGRNKPSLDFIEKVMSCFKDLNLDWLILGKGEMYQKKNTKDLFNPVSIPQSKEAPLNKEEKTEAPETTPKQSESQLPLNVANVANSAIVLPTKEVDKVIIFYRDKTFTSFSPSND